MGINILQKTLSRDKSIQIGLTCKLALCFLFIQTYQSSVTASDIVSIRSARINFSAQVLKGFRKCYGREGKAGSIQDLVLPKNPSQMKPVVDKIKSTKPKIILAIGDWATRHAQKSFPQIPFVYCMVADPDYSNLPETGVSASVAPADQIKFIRESFPQLQRIGIFYTDNRNKRVVAGFKKIQKNGDKNILMIKLSSSGEAEKAISDLKKKADCLLMLPNTVIYSSKTLTKFLYETLTLGLPVVSFSPGIVQAGALGSVSPDIEDNGCLAGDYVRTILSGKTSNQQLKWPQKLKLGINKVVAERLKIEINPATLKKADLVIQ